MHPSPIAETSSPFFPSVRFFITLPFDVSARRLSSAAWSEAIYAALLRANNIAPFDDPARAIVRRLSCSCGENEPKTPKPRIGISTPLFKVTACIRKDRLKLTMRSHNHSMPVAFVR
jgi:hypothetical protein